MNRCGRERACAKVAALTPLQRGPLPGSGSLSERKVSLVEMRSARYVPAMRTVIALLALAVAMVVVSGLLPGNGPIDYPLLLLGATVAFVVAMVRGLRLWFARRRRAKVVQA